MAVSFNMTVGLCYTHDKHYACKNKAYSQLYCLVQFCKWCCHLVYEIILKQPYLLQE